MASTQDHAELMAWACPYDGDPYDNYQSAVKHRQPGTGGWLTESDTFRVWSQHDHGIFWLRGLPGCGKTILVSTVVEYLQHSIKSRAKDVALAYFYVDYRDAAKQNLDACLSTLVRQLLDQNPRGMRRLERLREQKQRSLSRNLTTSDYVDILKELADLENKVYIVIDALDESPDPERFVDALKQISNREANKSPIVVLVTSRNNPTLEHALIPIVTHHVFVSNKDNNDIQSFVAAEVKKRFVSVKSKVSGAELIDLIITEISTRADGLFLQAVLLLDFVFAGKTRRSIRNTLTELPNGLEKTYETVLKRATSQNSHHVNEIKRSLQWLSMSFTPLTPTMLVEAAAIDPGDLFLDPEACMDETELVGLLSSLALVDWDHRPPLVSLAHKTVSEYLQSQSILQSEMSQYHIDARKTHQYLAETSIQYLLFPESAKALMRAARFRPPETVLQSKYHDPLETATTLAGGPFSGAEQAASRNHRNLQSSLFLQQHFEMHNGSSLEQDVAVQDATRSGSCLTHTSQEQALLNYVANLWPEHLKGSDYTTHDFMKSMAPRLQWYLYPEQDGGCLYKSWEAFQRRRLSSSLYFVLPFGATNQEIPFFRQVLKSSYFNYIGHETTQNPFFYTVFFGLDDCFDLLRTRYNMDMTFNGGWTPLTVATASGSFSIAGKLLEAGADVNKAADMDERNGLTPLHIAAELAVEDLAELLLAHGASIYSLTATMTTPFYRAARGGSVMILQLLYQAGSDVNAASWDDYIPLMEAVSWSNHGAIDFLLSWGADPHFQNQDGQSAIDIAVDVGDEGIVEKLCEARSKTIPKPVHSKTAREKAKSHKHSYSVVRRLQIAHMGDDEEPCELEGQRV